MKKAPNSWFQAIGHQPKGMTVDPYDATSLSYKAKTMVAMATYHLAMRRTIYILLHFLVMTVSLILTILSFVNNSFNDYIYMIIFIASLALGFITMIIVKNMIEGFRYINGGDLLDLSGLTKFLMAFAYIIATVWGFIAQLIMLMLAGSTTVSGAIRLCVPQGDLEDAYEKYQKEFKN